MATKVACPECGGMCLPVNVQTIKHHVQKPWLGSQLDGKINGKLNEQGDYYFCPSQGCATVYFSSQVQMRSDALRLEVGVKSENEAALICYCFDVSRRDAANPDIKAYVTAQTQTKQCACAVRNPSGRCCLKDFF